MKFRWMKWNELEFRKMLFAALVKPAAYCFLHASILAKIEGRCFSNAPQLKNKSQLLVLTAAVLTFARLAWLLLARFPRLLRLALLRFAALLRIVFLISIHFEPLCMGNRFPSYKRRQQLPGVAPEPRFISMAAHESARTTGLYDRRNDEISLDEVERIAI